MIKIKKIAGAQNISKNRRVNLCNIKIIHDNLIGSNISSDENTFGALGIDGVIAN